MSFLPNIRRNVIALGLYGGFLSPISAETLDFATIQNRVLAQHPAILSAEYLTSASAARVQQSQQLAKSELTLTREDESSGNPSLVIGLSQRFEPTNRHAKAAYFSAQYSHEKLKQQSVVLQLKRDLQRAYQQFQIAQARHELAVRILALGEKIQKIVFIQIEAGSVSPIEGERAKLKYQQLSQNTKQLRDEVCLAEQNLRNFWQDSSSQCEQITIEKLPLMAVRSPEMPNNLDFIENKLAESDVNISSTKIQLEKSQDQLSFEVFANFKRPDHHNQEHNGLTVGIKVSLPFWGHNQAGVRAALAQQQSVEQQLTLTRLDNQNKQRYWQQRLKFTQQYLQQIQTEYLPAAERIFEMSQRGYLAGKFDLNTVFSAQESMINIQKNYIDHLAEYVNAKTELQFLSPILSSMGE